MLTKAEKRKARGIIVIVFVVVTVLLIATNMIAQMEMEKQTGIEVRAFVGIPTENKLGGIEFEVSDRWGYDKDDRIIFFAYFMLS